MGGPITLRFDNADVYDVIQVVLGEVLKLDYSVDPGIQGKVTLRSTGVVKQEELLGVLETSLSSIGLSVVKAGNTYKVVRESNLAREKLPERGAGEASPVLRVVPLRYVQAAQLAATLKPFASVNAILIADPTNRYLIIADRNGVADRLEALVETLDTEYLKNIHIRLLKPKHGDATEIAKEMETIVKSSGLFTQPNTEAKAYMAPVPRLGAILVAASNEVLIQVAEKWFNVLDAQPDKDADATVHIYAVGSSNATHLSNLLQQIFYGAAPAASNNANQQRATLGATGTPQQGANNALTGAQGQQQNSNFGLNQGTAVAGTLTRGNTPGQAGAGTAPMGFAGPIVIIPDEITNSLIIKASAEDYQRVLKVLAKLDTLPKQVLIQVTIAEVALNDTLQYGVEWWLNSMLSHKGKSWAGKLGLEGNIKPSSTAGTVSGIGSGLSYAVLGGTGQVIGLLNLLGQDTNVNLLSAPHVLASDGKTARVEIGSEEPIITQTIQTPTTTLGNLATSNSVQYRPTGIILEVKPVISSNGVVSLAIAQEVSSRGNTVSVGGSEYPSFSKRRVTTDVVVEDGKSLLIAGLIEDKGDNTSVGIPVAKDVPLFGALFGTTKKINNKTELLITITPHIVQRSGDADRIASSFRDALKDLQSVISRPLPDMSKKVPTGDVKALTPATQGAVVKPVLDAVESTAPSAQ
ncbi:MAG: type secretion system protein GspD [Pseudomonadota bacterium]|jgi:general secretion pathway protein D